MENTIFKQGDTVYHFEYGEGFIIQNDSVNFGNSYPIRVFFSAIVSEKWFTKDGKNYISDKTPVLSFKPYNLNNGGFTLDTSAENFIEKIKSDPAYIEDDFDSHCLKQNCNFENEHTEFKIHKMTPEQLQQYDGKNIGKYTKFWNEDEKDFNIGILEKINSQEPYFKKQNSESFKHYKTLTEEQLKAFNLEN